MKEKNKNKGLKNLGLALIESNHQRGLYNTDVVIFNLNWKGSRGKIIFVAERGAAICAKFVFLSNENPPEKRPLAIVRQKGQAQAVQWEKYISPQRLRNSDAQNKRERQRVTARMRKNLDGLKSLITHSCAREGEYCFLVSLYPVAWFHLALNKRYREQKHKLNDREMGEIIPGVDPREKMAADYWTKEG